MIKNKNTIIIKNKKLLRLLKKCILKKRRKKKHNVVITKIKKNDGRKIKINLIVSNYCRQYKIAPSCGELFPITHKRRLGEVSVVKKKHDQSSTNEKARLVTALLCYYAIYLLLLLPHHHPRNIYLLSISMNLSIFFHHIFVLYSFFQLSINSTNVQLNIYETK